MYKYLLQHVDGLEWFAIVPLVLFFVTFCVVILMILFRDKGQEAAIAHLPLED